MKHTLLAAAVALIVTAASVTGVSQTPAPKAPAAAPTASAALLTQYCVTCHNARAKAGGLTLDAAELTEVERHAETW